jgi:hypothetical protein
VLDVVSLMGSEVSEDDMLMKSGFHDMQQGLDVRL